MVRLSLGSLVGLASLGGCLQWLILACLSSCLVFLELSCQPANRSTFLSLKMVGERTTMENKKQVTKCKKSQAIEVRDLSLGGLLTSHRSEFLRDKKSSVMIYNGSKKLSRWSGGFDKGKNAFTLYHYGTPIFRVAISNKSGELVKLPDGRKGLSWSDIRGINTVCKVFGLSVLVKKTAGLDSLVQA